MVFVGDQVLAPEAAAHWPSRATPLLLRGKPRPVFALPEGVPRLPVAPALAAPRRYLEPADGEPGRWGDRGRAPRPYSTRIWLGRKPRSRPGCRGKEVRVLAPPWGVMHPDLPQIAAETGHRLILSGYPYAATALGSLPIVVRPRLKGDAIWLYLNGTVRGAASWLLAQWQARRRVARGGVA